MGNKLLGNTALYAIGEVVPRILNFIMLPIFTRYLSPDDYGIISYTTSATVLLGFLGCLSLNSYVLRFYYEAKNEQDRKSIIGTAYMSVGLFNLIILLVCFLSMPSLLQAFNVQIPWNPFFRFAIIINFLTSFSTIPLVVYRVRQEVGHYIILSISKSVLTLLFNVVFIIALDRGLEGYFTSSFIVSIPYFFVYVYIIKKHACFRINLSRLKEGLSFALPLVPGAISYFVLSLFDRIVLERYEPLAVLGVYNIAVTFTSALGIAVQSGYRAFEPEIYKRYGTEMFRKFVLQVKKLYYFAIFVFAAILALFALEVFMIMTSSSYWNGCHYVPILIIGVILSGQNTFYQCLLTADKRTKLAGAISVTGAIVSFVFNMVFIPMGGAMAAAISYSVAYLLMNALLYKNITMTDKNLIRELVPVFLIAVVSILLNNCFVKISLISIGMKIFVLLLYIILLQKLLNFNVVSLIKNYVAKN